MRDCLICVTSALFFLVGCNNENIEERLSDNMNIEVSLLLPPQVDARTIDPNVTGFSLASNDVSLVLKNISERPLRVPAFEIARGVTRIYTIDNGKDMREFNISEPPSDKPNIVVIAPGNSWTYGVGFEYERAVYAEQTRVRKLRVCAVWNSNQLDLGLYQESSFDWAESFEACRVADVIYP